MLTTKDMALIAAKLQVPIVVSEILRGEMDFNGDAEYALHEIISEMQPDSALLSIALSVKMLAAKFPKAGPGIRVLNMECDRVIQEYGPLWLQNAEDDNGDITQDKAIETLSFLAEDLEDIAGLLDVSRNALKANDETAGAICTIMAVQAKAHSLIAEAYFSAIEAAADIAPMAMQDNVIAFPMEKRG